MSLVALGLKHCLGEGMPNSFESFQDRKYLQVGIDGAHAVDGLADFALKVFAINFPSRTAHGSDHSICSA